MSRLERRVAVIRGALSRAITTLSATPWFWLIAPERRSQATIKDIHESAITMQREAAARADLATRLRIQRAAEFLRDDNG